MVEALESADGLLWSSPLYQGSVAGSFKNALDWLHLPSRSVFLTDKPIGLISVSGGTQGLQAINAMEFSVRALRGWAVPYVVPAPRAAFEEDRVVGPERRAATEDARERGRPACRTLHGARLAGPPRPSPRGRATE